MKPTIKGGLVGFIAVFVGLLILLLFIGHEEGEWVCSTFQGPISCGFFQFITSPLHWLFILFFSWVGFFAGIVDTKIIQRIIRRAQEEKSRDKRIYLKITSTIVLTLVVVFGVIGALAFEDWVGIMVYAIIFALFVMLVSWAVEKFKYNS